MGSNPGQIKLGMHGTSVLSRTWTQTFSCQCISQSESPCIWNHLRPLRLCAYRSLLKISHWWPNGESRRLSNIKCTVMIWRSWVQTLARVELEVCGISVLSRTLITKKSIGNCSWATSHRFELGRNSTPNVLSETRHRLTTQKPSWDESGNIMYHLSTIHTSMQCHKGLTTSEINFSDSLGGQYYYSLFDCLFHMKTCMSHQLSWTD